MSDGIDVSRDGAVMAAAFARPEKKNAITSAMYEALMIDYFCRFHPNMTGRIVVAP